MAFRQVNVAKAKKVAFREYPTDLRTDIIYEINYVQVNLL